MANYGKKIYRENSKHRRKRNPKGVKFGIIELAQECFLEEENRRNDLCSANVNLKIKSINYSIDKTTDFSFVQVVYEIYLRCATHFQRTKSHL